MTSFREGCKKSHCPVEAGSIHCFVGGTPDWLKAKSQEEQRAYFSHAYQFFEDNFRGIPAEKGDSFLLFPAAVQNADTVDGLTNLVIMLV